MADVRLRGVSKSFDAVEVVRDVSIDIADGEFVVLVGPSGCGKSTILRMIAGLEDVGSGDISIGGRRVNDLPPKDRDVAMVFQNYALYPHMTVAKNMGFSLKLRGERADVVDRKVRAAAAVLGLESYLDRLPRQLSGGQRQRVAMGRSIVRAPRVFLFDEPLSNLDAKLRVQMRAEIRALQQRLKTTTIYVTHDQMEAMTMADRIAVLREGRVEQIGRPLDLYDRPANLFVAGFLGSPTMNVLEGTMGVRDGQPVVAIGGDLALPVSSAAGCPPGRPVTYGVRPEHVRLGATGLPAEILVVEPTGAETQVVLSLAGQRLIAVSRERLQAAPGDAVHLAVPAACAHLFDPDTGVRMS